MFTSVVLGSLFGLQAGFAELLKLAGIIVDASGTIFDHLQDF